ncbi:HupE/UreJ family protein [Pontivivens ytuae]|uniref:HupE/UreJ family protein n=1 Tax=Pontivivens ytuae TaxID=2789856 RepID=A0A7S9LNJ4_9RHOB|nr:HupE/UreJ family protein [Pontivivens ytuae]QPH52396.1 HupE/UreJ family protein [Pontivivens ytuae]
MRLLLALVLFLLPAAAMGHELRPAIVTLSLGDGAQLFVDVNLEAELAGIGGNHDDTDTAPEAAIYDGYRAMPPDQLVQLVRQSGFDLTELAQVEVDGVVASFEVDNITVPREDNLELPRQSVVSLSGVLPDGETGRLIWNGQVEVIIRIDDAAGEAIHQEFLLSMSASQPFDLAGAAPQSLASVVSSYIVIGFEHIIPKGWDHILFVVGLFLLAARAGPLIWQITAFTLAHTVTLALATLDVISLPAAIVEPLIALSITYVCVENVLTNRMTPWRPVVVFLFGLLHGLGFAGVLGEVGLSTQHFVASLIAFNVGVELGQLAVITICFLAVGIWFRNRTWYRQVIVIPASVVIGLVGLWWFIERTVLA